MPGTFIVTGIIELSHHKRSFKVYALAEGKKVFIGQVTRQNLTALLHLEIPVAEIRKFSDTPASLSNFSVELTTLPKKDKPATTESELERKWRSRPSQ